VPSVHVAELLGVRKTPYNGGRKSLEPLEMLPKLRFVVLPCPGALEIR
jgi:hypothetical protein